MQSSALIDTSFFLRFLNENDPLFNNANEYYKYLIEKDFALIISTIAIAEYCVGGSADELPLKNLRILPFNYNHALRAGKFAKVLFEARKKNIVNLEERVIIPNDAKLFAQAHTSPDTKYFLTSDKECLKAVNFLGDEIGLYFKAVDIRIDINQSILLSDGKPNLFTS